MGQAMVAMLSALPVRLRCLFSLFNSNNEIRKFNDVQSKTFPCWRSFGRGPLRPPPSPPPGQTTIGSGPTKFAIVEVNPVRLGLQPAGDRPQDGAPVSVTWNLWSGDVGQTAKVLLDGNEVWSGRRPPRVPPTSR